MKTVIIIIARMAIIVLLLIRVGLLSIFSDISFTREMSFEREKELTDSLREIAKPIVARAEKLASQNKYTVYMYFDDMTHLKLVEKSAGFNGYSAFMPLGTINHLQDLSYRNKAFDTRDIKAAQDKFLPLIAPNYGKQSPPVNWWDEVFKIILLWVLKWYFVLFPFALCWYITQLYANPKRLEYLKAKPLYAIGMLLIYPYTLLWGVLRKASDGYDYLSVATGLQRRGFKAKHQDVISVLKAYQKSNAKNLSIFFEERGFVVKHSMLIGFTLVLFSSIDVSAKRMYQRYNSENQITESSRAGPVLITHDVVVLDRNNHVYNSDYTYVDSSVLVWLSYLTICWYYSCAQLLPGFPPGIRHVPWKK